MDVPTPSIEALQAMSEDAWTDLQGIYSRRIYFFVKRYVDNHQTAEDLTQEVFLGAVKGIVGFDSTYTLDQYLFGIARNRVIDYFRKHKMALLSPKSDGDGARSALWIENMVSNEVRQPSSAAVHGEEATRQRVVLGRILREYVGSLWEAGDYQKLMILESLFVLGHRNKDVAARFGLEDEKLVAGIKFRAIDKLRGLARQSDPNHSLFRGLWKPGAR